MQMCILYQFTKLLCKCLIDINLHSWDGKTARESQIKMFLFQNWFGLDECHKTQLNPSFIDPYGGVVYVILSLEAYGI